MSVFRCFTMYDYTREFFFMFIRRGFELNHEWHKQRAEIELQLQEQKKKPEDTFTMDLEYGIVRAKYDITNKCYFLLLSNPKTTEEKQTQLLNRIIEEIQTQKQYVKMKREDLEGKKKKEIENMLEKYEQEYIKEFGFMETIKQPQPPVKPLRQDLQVQIQKTKQKPKDSDQPQGSAISRVQQQSQIHSEQNLSPQLQEQVMRPYRCFMMFDYKRQFFFMFVRRGFGLDKTWNKERLAYQTHLLEQEKTPPLELDYVGEFGNFKAKYDDKSKCYFTLLSRFGIDEERQTDMLTKIYDTITAVPNYIKLQKEDIEHKYFKVIEQQIIESEDAFQREFKDTSVLYKKQVVQIVDQMEIGSKSRHASLIKPQPQRQESKKNIQPSQFKRSNTLMLQVNDSTVPGEVGRRLEQYTTASIGFQDCFPLEKVSSQPQPNINDFHTFNQQQLSQQQ